MTQLQKPHLHWPLFFLLSGIAVGVLFISQATSLSSPKINVSSIPSGATVFVNGHLVGATPLAVAQLAPGTYSLRLEKNGYAATVKAVTLVADSEGVAFCPILLPIGVGHLSVNIKPKDAEILLDGDLVGHTPLKNLEVSIGSHELQVRKTNFKTQTWQMDVNVADPVVFEGFALEDQILSMLKQQIEVDKLRVAKYMDLGHYLYSNGEFDEAAVYYVKALQVAGTPLVFAPNTDPYERSLLTRLRAEDINRLNEEIKHKSRGDAKILKPFITKVESEREKIAEVNYTEWTWVRETADNFARNNQLEKAETILLKHIGATKAGADMLPQAYIALISLRLNMHNLNKAQETFEQFYNVYGSRAYLARQCANSIYATHNLFKGDDRVAVLGMAEKLLLQGVAMSRKGEPEQLSLCQFELANVMTFQGRAEAAISVYRESIDGTRVAETKDQRRSRLVDAYKIAGRYEETRGLLKELCNSKTAYVAQKSKVDLYDLDQLHPAPTVENEKK